MLFVLCLVPALLVVADAYGIGGTLGANPIEEIQDRFGNWGLRFILIALAVTPLRQLTGRNWLLRFRRMLGLFAFFYVLMHFLAWLLLDQGLLTSAIAGEEFDWSVITEDIFERPFITIGFAALLILVALAATSTAGQRRRLGRYWQKLHNGVYLAAVLGVWHYWWQVKKDFSEPLVYALVLAVLLGYRVWHHRLQTRVGSARNSRAGLPQNH
ncbi:MAG: sulfoxide reductase heme-binding subunit YedZ [Woeseiaceae bacterium]|nr:sulfoxide reductase heme-binding subunit YedZ [Woeseiaceae bacterium]